MTFQRPMFQPVDTSRRRFMVVATGASIAGSGALVTAATMAPNVPQAVSTTLPCLAVPADLPNPAFALIADKRAADVAHEKAIDAEAEAEKHGIGLDEAYDRCSAVMRPTRSTGSWRLHYRLRSPASPRCSGLRTRSRMPALNGPIPMRSVPRAGITSYGRPWRRRSRP
jgi:hypothetical protein